MTTIIGIDPGVHGAVAVIDSELATVHATPTIAITKRGRNRRKDGSYGTRVDRNYNLPDVYALLGEFSGAHVYLESAEPRRAEGVVSSFKSGGGYMMWQAFCVALGYPLEIVRPRVWQAAMFRGIGGTDPKQQSILAAQRLFPTVSLWRTEKCRVPDHNFADALLIAGYGQRLMAGLAM